MRRVVQALRCQAPTLGWNVRAVGGMKTVNCVRKTAKKEPFLACWGLGFSISAKPPQTHIRLCLRPHRGDEQKGTVPRINVSADAPVQGSACSNVSGMRPPSLASASTPVRVSCGLLTSCGVALVGTHCFPLRFV